MGIRLSSSVLFDYTFDFVNRILNIFRRLEHFLGKVELAIAEFEDDAHAVVGQNRLGETALRTAAIEELVLHTLGREYRGHRTREDFRHRVNECLMHFFWRRSFLFGDWSAYLYCVKLFFFQAFNASIALDGTQGIFFIVGSKTRNQFAKVSRRSI